MGACHVSFAYNLQPPPRAQFVWAYLGTHLTGAEGTECAWSKLWNRTRIKERQHMEWSSAQQSEQRVIERGRSIWREAREGGGGECLAQSIQC